MSKTVSAEGSETYLLGERLEISIFDTTDKAIRAAREAIDLPKLFCDAKVPELLAKIFSGDLVVLKKEEAVCPVCGYEFQSPFPKSKP